MILSIAIVIVKLWLGTGFMHSKTNMSVKIIIWNAIVSYLFANKKQRQKCASAFVASAGRWWIIIMRFKLHAGFALLNCCVAPFLGRSTNSVIMSTSNSNRWQMAIMQDYNAEHQIIWSSIDDPALSVGSSMENAIPCKKKYSCWAGLTFACNGLGWVGLDEARTHGWERTCLDHSSSHLLSLAFMTSRQKLPKCQNNFFASFKGWSHLCSVLTHGHAVLNF